MSSGSNIEWTDTTWNPVVGCTPVSPGCLNCYAATMSKRLGAMGQAAYVGLTVDRPKGLIGRDMKTFGEDEYTRVIQPKRTLFNGTVRCLPGKLMDPLWWKKPRRVFVNSMSDLFHEAVPFEFIDQVFAVMATCPQHTFQVLTKRPERMAEYLNRGAPLLNETVYHLDRIIETSPVWDAAVREDCWALRWPLPNVWLGTSCENQAAADERIPHLAKCPAVVRFLSCEPLLGRIKLPAYHSTDFMPVQWVIVGGESGAGARPCDVGWVRSIVGQCQARALPVFVKQLGAVPVDGVDDDGDIPIRLRDRKGGDPAEWPEDLRVREMPA